MFLLIKLATRVLNYFYLLLKFWPTNLSFLYIIHGSTTANQSNEFKLLQPVIMLLLLTTWAITTGDKITTCQFVRVSNT